VRMREHCLPDSVKFNSSAALRTRVHVRIPFVGNLITGAGASRIEAVVRVHIAHKVSCGGTMVGWRRSSPVFVEKGLSRLARQPKAAKAQAIAERVVLPRPEGTSENSRGQRPWKTTAPRWSSPDGARERRVGPAGFARSYRACPRTVLRSRGVAPGYFRLPFQGSVGRKTGYPVGETDKCAERHLFWNLDMHPENNLGIFCLRRIATGPVQNSSFLVHH